ncbi:ISWI chromatin-remodeling complex ATPase-like protein ISW2 [Cryomyces antarcticus]
MTLPLSNSSDTTNKENVGNERLSSSAHSLRPRISLSQSLKAVENANRSVPQKLKIEQRSSGRRSNTILVSDANGKSKVRADTARSRIRADIAAHTKVRQDDFMLANKDYFLPLLPGNNYIKKLVKSKGVPNTENNLVVPYKTIEEQPKGVKATMKPYQVEGLSFLVYMHENGMSAILGDEMGLGKTLQTLSLFQYLEEHRQSEPPSSEVRPYLVVCPLSVLSSWVAEAQKWTPDMKILRFHGPVEERNRLKAVAQGKLDRYGNETASSRNKKERRTSAGKPLIDLDSDSADSYDIVITSYETFTAEQVWFKTAFVWSLRAEHRLLLTGTPLQNNLHEMWALLHWLYPDVFTDKSGDVFKESFDLAKGKVSKSFMDDARRLLELIMLRRMKDSPGVDLGLPPKEEILLYVPLTPMQRFWYTRLLTRAGNALLEDLFRDVKSKEKESLQKEAIEDQTWNALSELERKAAGGEVDAWEESKRIMQQAVEQEQNDSRQKSAWSRLMNLILQLRKCCNHPYLLPNAAPDPYYVGDHVIRASGKFIVLEKLIDELVLKKRKKILIFAGLTRVLDCCEDLLALKGGLGENFRYLRLDGSTGRARRNLAIRMFNDRQSEYQVMLISTRAGGLGINLASASDVIFLDEDWNPQITVQAEARAHRIGQTQPVTVYKLCTQGTVEEQMMGRIRKKLYLSAKITESMRNIHTPTNSSKRVGPRASAVDEDMPQLGTSQLKSLIRRGAQTLSHPEVDVTEMLSWDWATTVEKCKDRPSDPHVADQASVTGADTDEDKWLAVMERVECAVFDGKKYQRGAVEENAIPQELSRADRRKDGRMETTVLMDGFMVNKESLLCEDWVAVPTLAGKDPRLAEPKREKKAAINNQEHCQVCWDGGDIILCSGCPRSYHTDCLSKEARARTKTWNNFYCPQHECVDCQKKTTGAGGLIFRCRWCEHGYCEDCLDWDKTELIGDNLIEYEMLGFPPITQAFYIRCHDCYDHHTENPEALEFVQARAAEFQALYNKTEAVGKIEGTLPTVLVPDTDGVPSRAESLTEATTVEGSGILTPQTTYSTSSTSKKRKTSPLEDLGGAISGIKIQRYGV